MPWFRRGRGIATGRSCSRMFARSRTGPSTARCSTGSPSSRASGAATSWSASAAPPTAGAQCSAPTSPRPKSRRCSRAFTGCAAAAVDFHTLSIQPRQFLGTSGFEFDYEHLDDDELWRKGRVVGAVVGGELYLVMFDAARSHYYDADAARFRSDRRFGSAGVGSAQPDRGRAGAPARSAPQSPRRRAGRGHVDSPARVGRGISGRGGAASAVAGPRRLGRWRGRLGVRRRRSLAELLHRGSLLERA